MSGGESIYTHINEYGRRYATKSEFRAYARRTFNSSNGLDLMRGESWNDWFEVYFASLIETGEARKVGNHYEVYEV